jgi:Phosphotransferase enzyme family
MISQYQDAAKGLQMKTTAEERFYLSPLELLHPDGVARRSLVVGAGCPEFLRPRSPADDNDKVDLVIVAPTRAEAATNRWLETAIGTSVERLGSDGLIYVLVRPGHRRRVKAALGRAGAVLHSPIAHIPSWELSRYLIPLRRQAARYGVSIVDTPRWKRLLARGLAWLPGGLRLVASFAPPVGLVGRLRDARPMFGWLLAENEIDVFRGAVIRTSWRGKDGAVIIHTLSSGTPPPAAVVKTALATGSDVSTEAKILGRIGASARGAGAHVPTATRVIQHGGQTAVVQTTIRGKALAALVLSRPNKAAGFAARVTSWLAAWNRATLITGAFDDQRLRREVLDPVDELLPLLEDGDAYRDRLAHLCSSLNGVEVPLVATHNDLTMWNVLLCTDGRLGILDWEDAREGDLPFVDFFYAITDIAAAASHYTDRAQAFVSCFTGGGAFSPLVRQLQKRMTPDRQLPQGLVELCLHACWLRHALAERQQPEPSQFQGFLDIVNWLAVNRFAWPPQPSQGVSTLGR